MKRQWKEIAKTLIKSEENIHIVKILERCIKGLLYPGLYNKDIYIGDINTETHPLNFDYRYTTIEQVLNLYNSQSDSIKLELRGDSLIVSGRSKSKSTR